MEYEISNGKCIIFNNSTVIDEEFFKDNYEISGVILPDTLKSIGERAFDSCTKLKAVRIPLSVTSIGVGAFSGCVSLESVEVEKGNPKFFSDHDCCISRSRNTLVFGCKVSRIPNGVEIIGESAFCGCGLVGIVLPESVRSIEDFAFAYNIGLTSISIPDALERIGAYAFYYCDELTDIKLPGSMQSIGKDAFCGCKKLKSIHLQKGIQCIGESAFASCGIESITIPSSVTAIESCAFYDCPHLTSIEIPDSVVNFGEHIWRGCHITDIWLPSGGPDRYNNLRKYLENEYPLAAIFDTYAHYTLHVPVGTEALYGGDPFFGQFGGIVAI